MPATPFHLPPSAVVVWPLRRRLDVPSVLLANLAIDIEPGLAMLLDLGPPPHGLAHTLLGGTVVGAATGALLWGAKDRIGSVLGGDYPLRPGVAMLSGAVGCWVHVLLDAVMYDHLRPFFPLEANPLYVAGSGDVLHLLGALMAVPAMVLIVRARAWRSVPEKLTLGLLGLSAVWMTVYAAIDRV
jgi:membrane-bound metal-dependent hydrolase YbcI (DUF457 family)